MGPHYPQIYQVTSLVGKVLLDTGANAVVRPYNFNEWANIEQHKPGTRRNFVNLAGGKL